jgi:hypothetical protein
MIQAVPNELLEAVAEPASAAEPKRRARAKPSARANDRSRIINRARAYLAKIPSAVSGSGGHDQTFAAACAVVRGFDLTIEEALPLLREYSERCEPPWSEQEILHKLEDADKQEGDRGYLLRNGGAARTLRVGANHTITWNTPPSLGACQFRLTDFGNSERLVRAHGEDFHHCFLWDRDLVWDGVRWHEDDSGQFERWAKETVRGVVAEAEQEPDEEFSKRLVAHSTRSESARAIRAMMSLARSEEGIPILPREMDRDAMLLNCINGTVDLRTGQSRPPDRRDLITQALPN